MAMTDEEKQSLEAAKASKTWRALRTATRTSFGLLNKVEPGQSLEEVLKQPDPRHDHGSEGVDQVTDEKVDDVST